MKLEFREIPLADGRTRKITTILDDPGSKDARRLDFIRMLVDNPMLAGAFEVLTISHDGKRWLAEFEHFIKKES